MTGPARIRSSAAPVLLGKRLLVGEPLPLRQRVTVTIAAMTMVATAAIALVAAPARAVATLVDATLKPSEITLGETAELTISRSGSTAESNALPTVDGLDFRIIGQSHRVDIVRGATLVTTALIVRVTPRAAGIYSIPGITANSHPLVLRVNPDTGAGLSRLGTLNGSVKAGVAVRPDGIRFTEDGSAYLRLVLPKHELYVGESVPIDIELGLRDGFVKSLNGLPTLDGADFTLDNLSRQQPTRVRKAIDGQAFTLLTWHSVLAGVKPGQFSLFVATPLTVKIRTRPKGESLLEDSLGDPFLQNIFGASVPKDITVSSPPLDVSVLPLPLEGRPPTFSGAVGSFKITTELSATAAAAGDPLTLRMHVNGRGNFDRVDSTMLGPLEEWKTYPPRSTTTRAAAAGSGRGSEGEKTFEQPIVATRPGKLIVPALSFDYFDPNTGRYASAHSAPLEVLISTPSNGMPPLNGMTQAGAMPQPNGIASSDGTGTSNGMTPPNGGLGLATGTPLAGLRPDHTQPSARHDSLRPLYLQAPFLVLPSLLSLAVFGDWLRQRQRQRGVSRVGPSIARRRRLSKAAERILRDLDVAGRSGNAGRYFNAARAALHAVIGDELTQESDDVQQIFALADEANYSGRPLSTTDFERWTAIVRQRLVDAQSTR